MAKSYDDEISGRERASMTIKKANMEAACDCEKHSENS